MKQTVILKNIDPDDFILGVRAARYLIGTSKKDVILSYGENNTKDFYVKRNKSSITVRPCEWTAS